MKLIDTQAAAIACNTTPAMIRRWTQLGKLKPHGKDTKGRNLYNLQDIHHIALARQK